MDADTLVRKNRELIKEDAQLRARIEAFESSRWWRLHPRFALQRLRSRLSGAGDDAIRREEPDGRHAFPLDFEQADVELCLRVAPYTMTTPPRIYALARAVEYVARCEVPGRSSSVACGVAEA
jgi:hypothetical protein